MKIDEIKNAYIVPDPFRSSLSIDSDYTVSW